MIYTKFDTVYGPAWIALAIAFTGPTYVLGISGPLPPTKRHQHAQRQITLANGSVFHVLDNAANLETLERLTNLKLGKPTWEPPKPKEPKPKAKRGAKAAAKEQA